MICIFQKLNGIKRAGIIHHFIQLCLQKRTAYSNFSPCLLLEVFGLHQQISNLWHTMTHMFSIITIIFMIALVGVTSGYSSSKIPTQKSTTSKPIINRHTFLATTSTACLTFLSSQSAIAKEVDPKLKGTKEDPAYQACLGQCIYDCTKPKGMEQKSRAECIPECKSKCATTKQQLMMGTPK